MTIVDVTTAIDDDDININMDINIFLPIHLKISSFLSVIWFDHKYSTRLFNLCDTNMLHRMNLYKRTSEDKDNRSGINRFCTVKVKDTIFQFTNYSSNLLIDRYVGTNHEASKYYPVFTSNNGDYWEAQITNKLYNFSFIITVNRIKYQVTFDEITIRNEHTDDRRLTYTNNCEPHYITTDDKGNKLYKGVVDFHKNRVLISKVSYEFKNSYSISVFGDHNKEESKCCMDNNATRDRIIGSYLRKDGIYHGDS